MLDESSRQLNNVIAPLSSATVGDGVTCISTAVTAAVVDLYDANAKPVQKLYNRYLTLMADGADIYVSFGTDANVTIDKTATNAAVAAGTTAVVPWLLKNGVPQRVRLMDTTVRYMYTQAASATPNLRIYPSSQPSFTASLQP